jgi:hypothetical protein
MSNGGSIAHWNLPERDVCSSCRFNEAADGSDGSRHRVTRLWESVYRSRPDLQCAFPDVFGADQSAFQEWIVASGLREHEIPEAFAPLRPLM